MRISDVLSANGCLYSFGMLMRTKEVNIFSFFFLYLYLLSCVEICNVVSNKKKGFSFFLLFGFLLCLSKNFAPHIYTSVYLGTLNAHQVVEQLVCEKESSYCVAFAV